MKAHEVLTERKWIKGSVARDAAGVTCMPTSPDAACWCLHGILKHTYMADNPYGNPSIWKEMYDLARETVRTRYGIDGIIVFNDARETNYEMVQAILKEVEGGTKEEIRGTVLDTEDAGLEEEIAAAEGEGAATLSETEDHASHVEESAPA
jgi:hypothetical protein